MKCAHCSRTIKQPGQYESWGHQLCSARCHGLYRKAAARAASRGFSAAMKRENQR